jgi:ATPase subunit of ABC transporter with duplicated ATPase domains
MNKVRNYYIERKTLESFQKSLKDLEFDFCRVDDTNIKEVKELDRQRSDLIYSMNEIDRTINTKLHIKVDGKYRCFNDNEFDMPIRLGDVNYIVGPNGCGKSTILQTIRAHHDSLYELNKHELDGMTSTNVDIAKCAPIEIDGITEKFTHVFALDAIEDDPCNFINAATAFSFVNGGGFRATTCSKGQKSKEMIGGFLQKIQKMLHFTIDDHKNGKFIEDSSSLIIVDEVDEGVDLKTMFQFDQLLRKLCMIFNGTVLCVTHNPLVCYGNEKRGDYPVFNMETLSEMTINEYMQKETGLQLDIK